MPQEVRLSDTKRRGKSAPPARIPLAFGIRAAGRLEAAPGWPQNWPNWTPRCSEDGPLWVPESPDALRRIQIGTMTCPEWLQGDLGRTSGLPKAVLQPFNKRCASSKRESSFDVREAISGMFWAILEPSWSHLGPSSGILQQRRGCKCTVISLVYYPGVYFGPFCD